MKIMWREDLATGNPEIDTQHRKLFAKIDDLITACKGGGEKDEIISMLNFLKGYIENHFWAEEQYQALHGFPDRQEHKRQHKALLQRFERLESEYTRNGVALPVITNSLMFTYEWLTNHILKADLKMARSCSSI